MQGDAAQVIQLGIDPVGDDAALLNLVGFGVGIDRSLNLLAHLDHRVDCLRESVQGLLVARIEQRLEHFDGRERVFELHQLAGQDTRRGDARSDALQVAYAGYLIHQRLMQLDILDEDLDHLVARLDLAHLAERHGNPALQQAATHRGQRAVNDIGKRGAPSPTIRREELEVGDR